MTYAADFYCQSCNKRITYQKHKRSGVCDKCLDKRNSHKTRKYGTLPLGWYTEVTATGCWCGGRIYDCFELRAMLRSDEIRIGTIIEYWTPGMRDATILFSVVENGQTGLAMIEFQR